METPDYSPEKKKAPLIKERAEEEFQKQLPYIEESIKKHGFDTTPEQYWQELENAVEFLEFDDYVKTVDKLIEDNKNAEEINIYYPNKENIQYQDSGNISNSYIFMIRLLKARLEQRSIDYRKTRRH